MSNDVINQLYALLIACSTARNKDIRHLPQLRTHGQCKKWINCGNKKLHFLTSLALTQITIVEVSTIDCLNYHFESAWTNIFRLPKQWLGCHYFLFLHFGFFEDGVMLSSLLGWLSAVFILHEIERKSNMTIIETMT